MSHVIHVGQQTSAIVKQGGTILSETVSVGDTAVSFHTPVPTGCEGGGSLDQVKSKVPHSGQVYISGGGGML